MKASFFQLITGAAIVSTLGSGFFTPAQAIQVYSLNFAPEGGGGRTGTGTGSITYDDGFNILRLQATFSGLSGNVTVAHLHGPITQPGGTVIVLVPSGASLTNFPIGNTFGTYNQTFDLGDTSTYRAAFITANGGTTTGARDALIAGLDAGTTYFNIHSTTFLGGEIRAFATAVPEPLTILGAATAVGFGAKFKRRLAQSQKG